MRRPGNDHLKPVAKEMNVQTNFVEQEIQELEDFSSQMFDAMQKANVDDINPAVISFALADILSLYCIHANIPFIGIANLMKSLYDTNLRLVKEEQSSAMQ